MADTAVGLFINASEADAVVDALLAGGIPFDGIRILKEPKGGSIEGSVSAGSVPTPHDFVGSIDRDLRSMGAKDAESDAYLNGVRRGHTLVFASGTPDQALAALEMMNEYGALEVEDLVGVGVSASGPDAVEAGEEKVIKAPASVSDDPNVVSINADEKSYTSKSSRVKSEGARVFSW